MQRLYDQLDFQRGCQAFLRHLMAAAVWGFREAFTRDVNVGSTDLAMLHLDANGLLLTALALVDSGTIVVRRKVSNAGAESPPGPMNARMPSQTRNVRGRRIATKPSEGTG
jgi:hypothetical protein